MEEKRKRYAGVNGLWPETVPELNGAEAISAAKRLYRFAMKRPFKGKWKLVSGNRYTWTHNGVFCVNPAYTGCGSVNGWHDLVHFMSHYVARRLHPNAKPHGPQHHFIEKEMVQYVLDHGWLDGKLKPKPHKLLPSTHERVLASLERWEAKRKRAENAIKKLRRKEKYHSRKEENRCEER